MKISDGLKRLQQLVPKGMSANGTEPESDAEELDQGLSIPPVVLIVPLAALVAGVALLQRQRTGTPVAQALQTAKAVAAPLRKQRRKPRNRVRFYAIGVLIGMLERDTTRRALISALKIAQKRA